jgi:hypothetical protein
MPLTHLFREQVDALDAQYIQKTLSQTDIIEQLAQLISNSPPESFVENTCYLTEALGRPGHALAAGSAAISVDAETHRWMLEILDAWSSDKTGALFKAAGNSGHPMWVSDEHAKHVKATPDSSYDTLQARIGQYQKLPVEGNADSLKAIAEQQRAMFAEAAKLVEQMPKPHQKMVFHDIEQALADKVNRIQWKFAQRPWQEKTFHDGEGRFEVDLSLAHQLGNAFYANIENSPQRKQHWESIQRGQFGRIMSGFEHHDPIAEAEPISETALRKPKGPR